MRWRRPTRAGVGRAVLRHFPVEIWHREQHTAELLREFQLLVAGRALPGHAIDVPVVVNRYAGLLEAIRQFRGEEPIPWAGPLT